MTPALRHLLLPALLLTAGVSSSAAAWAQPLQPDALATPVTDRWLAEYAQRIELPGGGRVVEERAAPGGAAPGAAGRLEDPGGPHRLRAALEIATVMGIYGANYYTGDRAVNRVDWDYDVGGSLRARFVNGDAYRYDDNSFRINRNHAYAGLYYYQFARANNLGAAESFLYSLAASSVWEYGIEYREIVSINDQILTPAGGMAIGEAFHQVGRLLARTPDSRVYAILAGVVDIPSAFHAWVDDDPPAGWDRSRPGPTPGDRSYVDLQATARLSDGDLGDALPPTLLVVDAGVLNVPGYAEPGAARLALGDTVSTRLKLQFPLNAGRFSDFTVYAQNTLAALYYKDLARTDGGGLRGYTLFVGPGGAFTLLNAALSGPDEHADFMCVAHLLGPVLDAAWYLRGTRVRGLVELYGDFGMVRSYAFGRYREINALPQGRSLLDVYGYYFGYGYTGSAALSVDRGPFELGAGIRHSSSWSTESRPRYPDEPNQDLGLRDSRTAAEAWVSWRVLDRVALRFALEKIVRDGSAAGFSPGAASEIRTFATLSYRLR